MKVILDISSVFKPPLTGIGRYVYELGHALERSGEFDELILWSGFKPQPSWPSLEELDPQLQPKFSLLNLTKNLLKKFPITVQISIDIKCRLLGKKLLKYNNYLFHGPNYYLPIWSGSKIVTIHDLSTLAVPDCHPPHRRKVVTAACKSLHNRVDYLLTVSEFSRSEIIRLLSWPPDKVFAAPLAPAAFFRPFSESELIPLLTKLGLRPQGYSLFVGTIEPRKNISILLDVYENLPDKIRNNFPLVIIGDYGWQSSNLHKRFSALSGQNWLRYFGYCSSKDLPTIVAGAALFLFPSLYEGFGLPPLEAMSCGVPTIVSNRASLPEVAGDAIPCLDAENVEVWREAIIRGLEDENWRQKIALAGLARAAEFSWDRCAAGTISAYKAVLA
jgi:alpha-1,3-rhamnosyl/mannosyltransferase